MHVASVFLATFLVVSFLGWVWESLLTRQWKCDRTLAKLGLPCLPLLTIYGLGGALLLLMRQLMPSARPLALALLAGLLLSGLECLCSVVDRRLGWEPEWQYGRGSFCNGYASPKVAAGWALAALGFFLLYDAAVARSKTWHKQKVK